MSKAARKNAQVNNNHQKWAFLDTYPRLPPGPTTHTQRGHMCKDLSFSLFVVTYEKLNGNESFIVCTEKAADTET